MNECLTITNSGASNSGDEHFSDASEGHDSSPPSGRSSPIPRTRVEKVDHDPRHGDVPGTAAYEIREQDAVPDEIEVVPEGSHSRSQSTADKPDQSTLTPDTSTPLTLVEKVDPNSPSYGDVPGTFAYEQRKADAVPDVVTRGSESDSNDKSSPDERGSSEAESATTAVPETRVSRVDTFSNEESESRPRAHSRHASDALPDSVETVQDTSGKLASSHDARSRERLTNSDSPTTLSTSREQTNDTGHGSTLTSNPDNHEVHNDGNDDGEKTTQSVPFHDQLPMDDEFDDFAQGQEDADEFGDFDNGMQGPEPEITETTTEQSQTPIQQPLATPPIVSRLKPRTVDSRATDNTNLANYSHHS